MSKPYKRVKCIVEHQTTYLKYKHNYEVVKENDKWYYFNFEDELIKYPKFYFIEIWTEEKEEK